jgi:hypothetical protein
MPGRIYGCLYHSFRLPVWSVSLSAQARGFSGAPHADVFVDYYLFPPGAVGSRQWRYAHPPQRGMINDAVPRNYLEQHGSTGKSK